MTHTTMKNDISIRTPSKGSVLNFDVLNTVDFSEETTAEREILALFRYPTRRDSSNPLASYLVIE